MKVQGVYGSVVRGVSQQAPADRLEGQHGEVVNMISDPVRGLVRRNGTVLETTWAHGYSASAEDVENAIDDGMSYRTFSYRTGNIDYDILYRSRPIVGAETSAHLPGLMMYSREYDNEQFIVVTHNPATDPDMTDYIGGGFSAVASIGEIVLFAGNMVTPTQTTFNKWADPANYNIATVWVQTGGYSRTYTITAKRKSDGQVFTVSHTTPPSAYPGTLDFSVITEDPSTPEYQAEVNNIQAAYDTAVNQHVANASAAIVPSAIAERLLQELWAAGWNDPDGSWFRKESTLLCNNVESITVDDGSNGTAMKEVLSDVTSPDNLTTIAVFGKIVRVTPPGADSYYMEAFPQGDVVDPSTDWLGRAIWKESAGVVQTPQNIFAIGMVVNGVMYVGTTPAKLKETIQIMAGEDVTVPEFIPSKAGDLETNPPPHFFGRTITMLAMFQDRLIVGSGGTITMSAQGDYFNFYRGTVLTLPDANAFSVAAAMADDDTIRKTTLHEMNLFVHGDKRHYMIPGRTPVTPTSVSMGVMWDVDNSAGCAPRSNGANLFIAKDELQVGATRLLQVQPGLYQDIPQLQDVSQQLRDYVNGFPAEMVTFLNPGTVFVRTEFVRKSRYGFPRSKKQGIYMYQYTDQGEQRVVDAWSSWEWSEHIGRPIGIAPAGFGDTLRIYTLIHGVDASGAKVRAVLVLRASIRPDPTGLPYLDAMVVGTLGEVAGIFTSAADADVRSQVFTSPGAQFSFEEPLVGHDPDVVLPNGPNWTVGDTNPTVVDPVRWRGVNGWISDFDAQYGPFSPDRKATIFTGVKFHAYAEITNPFLRNEQGKALTMGSLKLTRLHVILTRTAGFESSWKDYDGQEYVTRYEGDYKQINYAQSVYVGRDTKHVQIRLAARDWLPLTINGITWTGNWLGQKV